MDYDQNKPNSANKMKAAIIPTWAFLTPQQKNTSMPCCIYAVIHSKGAQAGCTEHTLHIKYILY